MLGHNVHVPLHPDLVQHVLLDDAANYVKPGLVKKLLRPTIGEGLLSSDGSLWRDQRRIVAANFAPAAIDRMVGEIVTHNATATGSPAAGSPPASTSRWR